MTKERKIKELEDQEQKTKRLISEVWEQCLGPASKRTSYMVIPNGITYIREVKPLYILLDQIKFAKQILQDLD